MAELIDSLKKRTKIPDDANFDISFYTCDTDLCNTYFPIYWNALVIGIFVTLGILSLMAIIGAALWGRFIRRTHVKANPPKQKNTNYDSNDNYFDSEGFHYFDSETSNDPAEEQVPFLPNQDQPPNKVLPMKQENRNENTLQQPKKARAPLPPQPMQKNLETVPARQPLLENQRPVEVGSEIEAAEGVEDAVKRKRRNVKFKNPQIGMD